MAGFHVAASVADAHAALDYLSENRVDVILLDVEMPGVDGLTALPDLLTASGRAKVLVVSSSAEESLAATVQALALGGADTLVKPGAGNFAGRFADVLEERLTRLLDCTNDAVVAPIVPPASTGSRLIEEFDLVAIGASTGGIHALSQLLRAIPREFQKPILVTQHLPVSFMGYFATQLALLGGRPCDVATDRMRIRSGRIYVAPGNAHLRVARMSDGAAIRLSDERSLSGCMPSVDPMFESIAEVFGRRALGIVLSGMGRDGSDGARKLAETGASVVVQDRESSVVWGMPGAVASSGSAAAVLNPEEIGHLIATRRKPL
jgi:two-component system chemotaxis response regulator CheB